MAGISTNRRITIALPERLVTALDRRVASGAAATRTDLIADAVARELERLEREEIDAEFLAGTSDPKYLESDRVLGEEFEATDSESWKDLDDLDGGYLEPR